MKNPGHRKHEGSTKIEKAFLTWSYVSAILILLSTFSSPCIAQANLLRTIELSDTIVSAYIDRPGDIYLLTKDAQIQKFDKDGNLIVLYKHTTPTLFDPRDGARLFAYYRKDQHYEYLTSSFELVGGYQIDSAFIIEPWLIAPSTGQKLWMLDGADNSLKKVNPTDSHVEVEVIIEHTVIDDVMKITAMREYQNFVFLFHPAKGLLVFNSMGKYIRTIPINTTHFNFLGEELYYINDRLIHFFDLFTTESRSIPLKSKAKMALITDDRLLEIKDREIRFYQFTP